MTTTTLLSVDLDYWVPQNPTHDFGARETPFMIRDVWGVRALGFAMQDRDIRAEIPLAGDPPPGGLLARLFDRGHLFRLRGAPVHVAESHASAYHAFRRGRAKLRIVNIDAHHDVRYAPLPEGDGPDPLPALERKRGVACGDWIGALVRAGRVESVTVVYPEWRDRWPEDAAHKRALREHLRERHGVPLEFVRGIDALPPQTFGRVFLCRSGAWVPPWHDAAWADLCGQFCLVSRGARVWNYESFDGFARDPIDFDGLAGQARRFWETQHRTQGAGA